MTKKIDDIVSIPDNRKKALLRAIDNYGRFPTNYIDAVSGFKELWKNKTAKNDDELVFLAWIMGSMDGSQITIKTLSKLGNLNKVADKFTPEQISALFKTVDKHLDKVTGKDEK